MIEGHKYMYIIEGERERERMQFGSIVCFWFYHLFLVLFLIYFDHTFVSLYNDLDFIICCQ